MHGRCSIPKWKYEKLAVVVRILQTTQNLVISRSCFAEDGKGMYKDLYASAQLLFCSLNLLFGDILVAVIVPVCLSSLLIICFAMFPLPVPSWFFVLTFYC